MMMIVCERLVFKNSRIPKFFETKILKKSKNPLHHINIMEKMDIDEDSKVETVKGAKAKEAELRAQIAPMMVQAKAYAKVSFFFFNRR